MSKKSHFPPQIETKHEFRQCLLSALSKFNNTYTIATAIEELKELMVEHITNTDRMNTFLYHINEQTDHLGNTQKKEYIKVYGIAAEIFEDSLIPFLPKVLSQIQQKLKVNDQQEVHNSYAESIGMILHNILKNIESIEEAAELLTTFLKMIFTNLNQPGRIVQSGAALWLTKIIQNAPVDALRIKLEDLCQALLDVLNSNNCRAHTQVLEAMIALLLSVEQEFEPFAVNFLPTLLECMALNEWHTRKIGIDVMYTIAAILGDVLLPYTKEILEVLNHCRFDKMKPVREAAIEAINLIKDLDPSAAEEIQSQDSATRRDRSSRVQPPKPWKKKSKKTDNDDSNSMIAYNNQEQDDDIPEGKISLATRKRREAQEAKKKAKEAKDAKKPNLNKEKKSIFAQKRNPNFFNKSSKPAESKAEPKIKDEERKGTERAQPVKNSPKKPHNFYYQQDQNFEDTPDFHESNEKVSDGEEEKRMELSNEKSNDSNQASNDKKHKIMAFDIADENDEEDDEAVHIQSKASAKKAKKHRFTTDFNYNELQDDMEEQAPQESDEKVEETPEEQEALEESYVIGQKPRSSHHRKYKAWEKPSEQKSKQENEEMDPEKEYNTIAERIRNRNRESQQEYHDTSRSPQQERSSYVEPNFDPVQVPQNPSENKASIKSDNVQMMNKLQNLRNQWNDIETNMERMIDTNKNFYSENPNFQQNIRHTINVPPGQFQYNRDENLGRSPHSDFPYNKGAQSSGLHDSHSNIRNSHFEINKEPIDVDSRSPHQRVYENTPTHRSQSEQNQISMLVEEIKYMKAQQDKILENQNIFQTYISNEITNLKNKMNQMESDMLLPHLRKYNYSNPSLP